MFLYHFFFIDCYNCLISMIIIFTVITMSKYFPIFVGGGVCAGWAGVREVREVRGGVGSEGRHG